MQGINHLLYTMYQLM